MNTKEEHGWNIYTRSEGQHVLQFRLGPGDWDEHRIPRVHRTERRAERYALPWLNEYRKRMAEGRRPELPEPEAGPTLRMLADKWLELRDKDPKLSAATRMQNRSNIQRHVLTHPKIADVPVSEPKSVRASTLSGSSIAP